MSIRLQKVSSLNSNSLKEKVASALLRKVKLNEVRKDQNSQDGTRPYKLPVKEKTEEEIIWDERE